MMSGNSVMVTGVSLVTAAGGTTRESWSSLRAGRTGIVRNSLFDTSELLSDWAGQVTTERTGRIDRCYSLAERGVAQALAQAGLTPSDLPGPRTALVVGSSLGAMESLQAAHREAVLNDTVDAVTALDSRDTIRCHGPPRGHLQCVRRRRDRHRLRGGTPVER